MDNYEANKGSTHIPQGTGAMLVKVDFILGHKSSVLLKELESCRVCLLYYVATELEIVKKVF